MLTFLKKIFNRDGINISASARRIDCRLSPSAIPAVIKIATPSLTSRADSELTCFHITHWKAGSQWIHRILHMLAYDRLVLPTTQTQDQFFKLPIQEAKIYPTVYVTKEQFDTVQLPKSHRRFVIIRDLRDTLISLYFSSKISHVLPNEESAQSH